MFLAAKPGHHSIAEIADGYGISRNHLMKVAQRLVAEGFVNSVRGRGGGLVLARDAKDINAGAVVRTIEGFGAFVECFPLGRGCVVTPVCGLRHALAGGLDAFLDHLDRFTIADLVADPAAFRAALRQAGSLPQFPEVQDTDDRSQ